jgi:hypothetical protein
MMIKLRKQKVKQNTNYNNSANGGCGWLVLETIQYIIAQRISKDK